MIGLIQEIHPFGKMCLNCLTFGTGGFYLAYGLLILITGLTMPAQLSAINQQSSGKDVPELRLPDIGVLKLNRLSQGSIISNIYIFLINILRPVTFLKLSEFFLNSIEFILGIKDKEFNYWTVFKKFFLFYFILIPLPAAFMAPVGYVQAQPDLHLMVALVLLIFVNAIGDTISTRITTKNFRKIIDLCKDQSEAQDVKKLSQGMKFEAKLYFTAIKDLFLALIVLCVVLSLSSILFGIQISSYKFSLDGQTLSKMFERAVMFPELLKENYWFREINPNETTSDKGIPGMFLFAVSTFIPTIIMLLVSLFWTLTIPLRLLLQLPKSKLVRIVTAEASVIGLCVFVSVLFGLTIPGLYSFLATS